jgi:putative NADH-flavin reductase
MHLLVLGATGGTGREVVSQALAQGHDVTAFVRDRTRLPITSERLRVVEGDIDGLGETVEGQDAVISALGAGKSFKSDGLIQRAMPLIIDAMNRSGVRRLIFMSAFGVGDTWSDIPLLPRIFVRMLLRDLYADKAAAEQILSRSNLDWTLVYPAGLTNKARTGRYRTGEHIPLSGFPTIARADVAEFMLKQAGESRYSRKRVLIAQ